MPRKLSPAMQEVVDCMVAGWELGLSVGQAGHPWLQKDGLGRGGDTKDVRLDTFYALYKRGLIKAIDTNAFPNIRYRLEATDE